MSPYHLRVALPTGRQALVKVSIMNDKWRNGLADTGALYEAHPAIASRSFHLPSVMFGSRTGDAAEQFPPDLSSAYHGVIMTSFSFQNHFYVSFASIIRRTKLPVSYSDRRRRRRFRSTFYIGDVLDPIGSQIGIKWKDFPESIKCKNERESCLEGFNYSITKVYTVWRLEQSSV